MKNDITNQSLLVKGTSCESFGVITLRETEKLRNMFKTNVTGRQGLTSFQNELVLVRDTGHFTPPHCV